MSTKNPQDSFSSTSSEVYRGVVASLPVMIGFVPFALVLGALARQKGFSVLEVPLLTGLNFAGGSEFAALELWTSPPHILLLVAITFLVNSRHLLMGAVLSPFLNELPKRKALPALFFMCDESWAMGLADAHKRLSSHGKVTFSLPYYLGVSAGLYCAWVIFTALGAVIGPLFGNVKDFGFDMAFPAIFIVLLKGMWRGLRPALPWFASLIVAVLFYIFIPGAWYVPAGAVTGIVTAFALSEKS